MKLVLGIGTNLGNRINNLENCIKLLNCSFGDFVELSPIFESEPFGDVLQDYFYNLVVVYEVNNTLTPNELLSITQSTELKLGRKKSAHWGPRIIDIDILFLDSISLNSENLVIPHPHINDRSFVVMPLQTLTVYSWLSSFYNFSHQFQTKSVEIRNLF